MGANAPAEPQHVVLYDGTCGFCERTTRWIVDADRAGRFHFAPLQGPTAAAILARHPDVPMDLDSVVYVDRSDGPERVYTRSDAAFRIAERLGGLPRWLRWTRRLPRRLTDVLYRAFARSRHRVSSAMAPCPLPPPTVRARFLP